MAQKETERQRLGRRLNELKAERSAWEKAWKAIFEQVLPYRPRWTAGDFKRGDMLNATLLNNTPVEAINTQSAGLMAGVTSPAKAWFHLTTNNSALNENKAVKAWLEQCEERVRHALEKSNFYRELTHGTYPDLGSAGVSVLLFEKDEKTGNLAFESVPVGEYYLDTDARGKVDTFMREYSFTVRQLVEQFTYERCSPLVKQAWDNNQLGRPFQVIQAIYPNSDYRKQALGRNGKRWASKWWEVTSPDQTAFLKESGYDEFPVMAPRWSARSREPYGHAPGWYAVFDCRELQYREREGKRMVDMLTKPPMRGSAGMKRTRASLLPGDITFVPDGEKGVFEPAVVVSPVAIEQNREEIRRIELRINRTFFVHLWQMLIDDDRAQRATATEIAAKQQEAMLMLGPLLENLNWELLDPVVTRAFAILQRDGAIEPPPPELDGMELRIQFVSIMHQAQHMVGIAGIRELETHVMALVQGGAPQALQKINIDRLIETVADMAGVKQDIVRAQEEVDAERAEVAKQQQAAQDGEAMMQGAKGLRDLSGADPQRLSELANVIAPAAAAQGGMM